MRFIHTSDLHLGFRQYGLDDRFSDFGGTFREIADDAIRSKVDFMIISGDLFDSRNINAPTFTQAYLILSMLKDAGIPCIAIEGNHDRAFLKDGMSWLETLEYQGLLRLLKPGTDKLMENYVDIGQTRIYGMCYAGSMTSSIIPRMAKEIKELDAERPEGNTILMMHLGVEGMMKTGIIGEVSYDDLIPLKDCVNYLALGHYHNKYEIEGWVYNPGSPDTCSISEVSDPKGYYFVENGKPLLKDVDRRPFIMMNVNVDEHKTVDTLYKAIEKDLLKYRVPEKRPVVYVNLRGHLNFDKIHIDMNIIKEMVSSKLNALFVEPRLLLTNDEFSISRIESENYNRTAIEREVFGKIISADSMLSSNSEDVVDLLSELKELAAEGADEMTLDSLLRKMFDDLKNGRTVMPKKKVIVTEEKPIEIKTVTKPTTLADMIEDDTWNWRQGK